jgi:signal transduction histidine kinase
VNSLRARLLAAFAYVLALVLVALAVPFALSVSNRVEAEVEGQAEGQAHLVAATVAGRLDEPSALRQLVRGAAGDVSGRVVVVDSAGRTLADSAGTRFTGRSLRDRPEIAGALARGTVEQGRRQSETLGEELLYTAVPVVENGRRVGAVRMTRGTAPIAARIRRDRLAVAGIAAAALVLGLALAWLLAGSLARPLRNLAGAAGALGRGDLDARAEPAGPEEQQEVARAFNDMAERLAQMVRAQNEFVANASHQLRTPLTGLRLRLEAAAAKSDDPGVEHELEAAEREAERLADLLTALLVLAREGGERPAPADVALLDAAEQAAERWSAEAAREGRRVLALGGDVHALASHDDVAIVLDNLVENALHYSSPGEDVEIEATSDARSALLAVLDRGPGIGVEEADLVWERFARGSAARGGTPGTGLGLTIVRTLAQRWGGDARAEPRAGGGTRMVVSLPPAETSPAPRRARDREAVA